jgi:GLUG motif-containing protein
MTTKASLVLFFILTVCPPLWSQYSGGDGSTENPYQIANVDDLLALGGNTDHYDAQFILTSDIDLTGYTFTSALIAPDTDGSTLYFQGMQFIGIFDGNGHTISNLIIDDDGVGYEYLGLFGHLGSDGQVKNLGLLNASIQGCNYIGIFVGYNCGTISGCYATGVVYSDRYTGGLAGYCDSGTIINCYVAGSITGDVYTGGIVGRNNESSITNSYATGSVTGNVFTGGLVGSNRGPITNCYATAVIIGDSNTGGLIGNSSNEITNCFWDRQVSGQDTSGGGTGLTTSQMQNSQIYSYNGWGGTAWTMPANDYPHLAWENAGGEYIFEPTITPLTGSGTTEDPWQINSVADLILISSGTYFWDKHFILITDIDLTGITINRIGYDENHRFTGSFDGQGHTIANLTINLSDQDHVGLFGFLGSGAQVMNLGIVDGDIQGKDLIGGLVGYNDSSAIANCFASGTVIGDKYTGGLVGHNNSGTITNCYSMGTVTGNDYTGGLVGYQWGDGMIMNCYSTGVVTGLSNRTGGLVGCNHDTITNCYATGVVTGVDYTGGLVGCNYGAITNCYVMGVVTGIDYTGGLVGDNDIFGGMITNCFWDRQTSEQENSDGGIGLTTVDMQDSQIYSLYSWGGMIWTLSANDYPHLAWENAGGKYISDPVVPWAGSGTVDDPWKVAAASDLVLISSGTYFWDKHYILKADINMTEISVNPIGYDDEHPFTGSFDGQNHILSNLMLYLPDQNYVGMFGCIGSGGQVKNLGLENVHITGGDDSEYLGGLCGYNYEGSISDCYSSGLVTFGEESDYLGGLCGYNDAGSIIRCYSTSDIIGGRDSDYLGGLCGCNDFNSNINDCYATGLVTGGHDSEYLGGLCGSNEHGSISNSYATGFVSGDTYVGGLCGMNYGRLTQCYATGIVTAGNCIGGLCGKNQNEISECYAISSISGRKYSSILGGLCGYNRGKLYDCYSRGSVAGGEESEYLGGLCGYNYFGSINNCYTTVSITCGVDSNFLGSLVGEDFQFRGSYSACFWDLTVNPTLRRIGNWPYQPQVYGEHTDELQFSYTYADKGWDFDSLWRIYEGIDYPSLSLQEDALLEIAQIIFSAGKTPNKNCDSFSAKGTIEQNYRYKITNTSNDWTKIIVAVIMQDDENIYGHVEKLESSKIIFDSKRSKITYRSSMKNKAGGGISFLVIELDNGKFSVIAKNLDLTGMRSPVKVELTVGDYTCNGIAYDGEVLGSGGQLDTINGKDPIPIQFMMGHDDVLRVDKCKFKQGLKKPNTDSLTVQGELAVADTQINIATEDVIVQWGNYSVTLPADHLFEIGTKKAFKYKKSKGFDSSIAAAIFDLEKCTFKIVIKNADIGDQGDTVDFGIQFGSFAEIVSVTP